MNLDEPVCLCFRVTRRKLENYARRHPLQYASQLSECGGAGTGCGWCIPLLVKIHARESAALDALPSADHEAGRDVHLKGRQ